MANHFAQRSKQGDAPQTSRKRTIAALCVLAVLVIAVAVVGLVLWNKAQQDTSLGDVDLATAVEDTSSVESSTVYDRSDANFTNVLFLIVEDADASTLQLASVQLACLNTSTNLGYLVYLPVDVLTSNGDTLSDIVVQEGAAAAVSAVAESCKMSMSHVMVVDQDGFDELLNLASSSSSDLLSSASVLLESLTTDMNVSQLVSLAQILQSIGVGNLSVIEAPLTQDGTMIDPDTLGVYVGYLKAY